MGNHPSVNSIPSTNVPQDVAVLKRLFPDTFRVETMMNHDSDGVGTATLFANDGKLTLILVAIPRETCTTTVATALVMDGSDIKAVLKRQQHLLELQPKGATINGANSYIKEDFITADIKLPGGSVVILVPPNMLGSRAGRQQLAQTLTDYSHSKPQKQQQRAVTGSSVQENGQNKSVRTEPVVEPLIANKDDCTPQQDTFLDNNGGTVQVNGDSLPEKLPSFATLDFRLLQENGRFQPNFPLNSRAGVPFETDLFQGHVLVLLRPEKPEQQDPYWNEKIWKHKQRRIIVQVQGKFKKKPKGILYAGGEVSDPMKLGLLAKG